MFLRRAGFELQADNYNYNRLKHHPQRAVDILVVSYCRVEIVLFNSLQYNTSIMHNQHLTGMLHFKADKRAAICTS